MEIKDTKDQYQLVKLSPEEISEKWEDGLMDAIEASLPPLANYESPERMNNILRALCGGGLECWTLWLGDDLQIVGVFELIIDHATGNKSLLIYALYSYSEVSYEFWGILLKSVRKTAKEKGCSRIVAYSNVDRVVDIINALGGNSEFRFLSLEV